MFVIKWAFGSEQFGLLLQFVKMYDMLSGFHFNYIFFASWHKKNTKNKKVCCLNKRVIRRKKTCMHFFILKNSFSTISDSFKTHFKVNTGLHYIQCAAAEYGCSSSLPPSTHCSKKQRKIVGDFVFIQKKNSTRLKIT